MQVLKEYIRENIVTSAKSEFINKGFTKASMREIATNAGITVGNIYRYFESKEVLFEAIVHPAYEKMNLLIDKIDFENIPSTSYDQYIAAREQFTQYFVQVIKDHRDEIIILMHCSDGTRFKESKSQFAHTIENRVKSIIGNSLDRHQPNSDADTHFIAKVVSKNVVDGLTELVIHNGLTDFDQLTSDVRLLMDLYFNKSLLAPTIK